MTPPKFLHCSGNVFTLFPSKDEGIYRQTYRHTLTELHRSPASRRRRRKWNPVPGAITGTPGSLGDINKGTWPSRLGRHEFETVKYGHEYRGTRTREWLRWRGPTAIVNNRPVISSERASYINKLATLWQKSESGPGPPDGGARYQDTLGDWLSVVTNLILIYLEQFFYYCLYLLPREHIYWDVA
jgi:hypothetical protein